MEYKEFFYFVVACLFFVATIWDTRSENKSA